MYRDPCTERRRVENQPQILPTSPEGPGVFVGQEPSLRVAARLRQLHHRPAERQEGGDRRYHRGAGRQVQCQPAAHAVWRDRDFGREG